MPRRLYHFGYYFRKWLYLRGPWLFAFEIDGKNFFFFVSSYGSVFYAHESKKRKTHKLVSKIFIDLSVPFSSSFPNQKILVPFFLLVYIKRYFSSILDLQFTFQNGQNTTDVLTDYNVLHSHTLAFT